MKINYFNFKQLENRILITNDFGQHIFLENNDFKKLVSKDIKKDSALWNILMKNRIIYEETDLEYSSIHKYDLREIKNHMGSSTALHIFVVNTACNMNCIYCQANNGKEKPHLFMDKATAEKAVDIALQSPTKYLNFEFQGGEPLLNFEIIKHIVKYTEQRKGSHEITYNVVSNLTLLTDDIVQFFVNYNFGVSTSIDGSERVHNNNRRFLDGTGTFSKVLESVKKLRDSGIYVGAIETTTKSSLEFPEEIVQAYAEMGFDSIFIRPLTPLGKATVNWGEIGYSADQFIEFYLRALKKIIEINKSGQFLKEAHASIFLKRISGQSINYMELRSPCGAGIGQMAYYSDGNVFTCDEGRMLYEMGQDAFKLGNVFKNTFAELINNGTCRTVCSSSILETIPTCCDCTYQPYCGVCPVVNFAKDNDVIEKNPHGYRCKIYSGILDWIFTMFLENDESMVNVLKSWGN